MNELLQLLLLSTAATTGLKAKRSQVTNRSSYNKKASLIPEEVVQKPRESHLNKRQEITRSKLLSALNAADAAIQLPSTSTGPFTLAPLDYDYNALEPYIPEKTLRLHHDAHHQNYVNQLNSALERYPETYNASLNELLLFPDCLPSDIQTQVTNNAGGHYNHALMWKVIGPPKNSQPTGALAEAIDLQFGSFENFKRAFATAAESVFGSGYAYLVLNPYGRLIIVTTNNQTTPIPLRVVPLLPLDVWEHAYYLKHQNNRKDYINDYMHLINWDQVDRRYEAAENAFQTME